MPHRNLDEGHVTTSIYFEPSFGSGDSNVRTPVSFRQTEKGDYEVTDNEGRLMPVKLLSRWNKSGVLLLASEGDVEGLSALNRPSGTDR